MPKRPRLLCSKGSSRRKQQKTVVHDHDPVHKDVTEPDSMSIECLGASKSKQHFSRNSRSDNGNKGQRKRSQDKKTVHHSHCIVPGCSSHKFGTGCQHLAFTRLPWRDTPSLKQWLQKINPDSNLISKHSVVCSLHFEDHCFDLDFGAPLLGRRARKKLKPGAVPTRHFQVKLEDDTAAETEDYVFDEHVQQIVDGEAGQKGKKISIECGHCSFVATSLPMMQTHMIEIHNYTDIAGDADEGDGDEDHNGEEEVSDEDEDDCLNYELIGDDEEEMKKGIIEGYPFESHEDVIVEDHVSDFIQFDSVGDEESPIKHNYPATDMMQHLATVAESGGHRTVLEIKPIENSGSGDVSIDGKNFDYAEGKAACVELVPPTPLIASTDTSCQLCDIRNWSNDYDLLVAHLKCDHGVQIDADQLRRFDAEKRGMKSQAGGVDSKVTNKQLEFDIYNTKVDMDENLGDTTPCVKQNTNKENITGQFSTQVHTKRKQRKQSADKLGTTNTKKKKVPTATLR